ncbi:MAG TPA: hypothetical protein VJ925_12025, partial [Longimicrobiales bacterium]|nr:hypothetical protein [Longimicrobiales bacterium]
GFALLFPPTRALVRRAAVREIMKRVEDGRLQVSLGGFGAFHGSGGPGAGPEADGWRGGGSGAGGAAGDDEPLDPRNEIRLDDDDRVS